MSEEYIISKKADMIEIADAIRNKIGSNDSIALNNMKSLIEGIETDGGANEILSLFGGSKYKIGSVVTGSDNKVLKFPCIENLTSVDDVKLVVAIHSNYVEGISLAIPESLSTGSLLYIGISVNGISGEFYISSDSTYEAHTYNANNNFTINNDYNYMILNTEQSHTFKAGTIYYLIIYNETQE